MIRNALLVAGGGLAWVVLGLIVGALSATTVFSQATPPPPAQQAQAVPAARVFTGETGLVLNFIKPDKTKDFEAVIAKLKDALTGSAKPERKEQAKSWRGVKASDAAAGRARLFVFFVDFPLKGAGQTVTHNPAQALPPHEL